MTWAFAVTEPAEAEPVTEAEAREWCRIDGEEPDIRLTASITGARALLEQRLNHGALLAQTITMTTDNQSDLACLPVFPVLSIESIVSADATDVSGSFTSQLVGKYPSLSLSGAWPGRITVTAICGFGFEPADVPPNLKIAMLHAIGAHYDSSNGELGEGFWTSISHLLGSSARPVFA